MKDILTLFANPELREVHVLSSRSMFLEFKNGERRAAQSPFSSPMQMMDEIQDLAMNQGLRLDPLQPVAGGGLEDNTFRWHCVLPPIAQDGPLLSVRRHQFLELSPKDFEGFARHEKVLGETIENRVPLIIAGATASGKSSFLVALLREHALNERTIILEDLAELPLLSPSWVRLLSRGPNYQGRASFDLAAAFRASLRLTPDRLVIGEIRGKEMATFLDALLSGHSGLMTTIHAGSAHDVLHRLARHTESNLAQFQTEIAVVHLMQRSIASLVRLRLCDKVHIN